MTADASEGDCSEEVDEEAKAAGGAGVKEEATNEVEEDGWQ